MKYIISENRMNEIMTEYLNGWAESRTSYRNSPFIIIEEPSNEILDDWDITMEYDMTDGRLYVSKKITKHLMDLFGKNEKETRDFVGKWFENHFDVEVEFIE